MRTTSIRLIIPLLISCSIFASVGCDSSFELIKAATARYASPDVSSVDADALARGNAAFALDLYGEVAPSSGNLFLSPYSISTALAMTYAGARGTTEAEMAEALHFTLSQERLHAAFNALDWELESRKLQLMIANSIWVQQGYTFLPEFLNILAENYGAGLRIVDFINNTEGARRAINQWVGDKTLEKIPKLLERGMLSGLTRMVLVNAIYFNADWASKFKPERTRPGEFRSGQGGTVTVPMMHQVVHFKYTAGDGFQVVRLPYEGHKTSMLLMVPDKGRFSEFESRFDVDQLDLILQGLDSHCIDLRLPKFEFESAFSLKSRLQSLGMMEAFGEADFSGMDGTERLFISNVIHKTYIRVDEDGTEAAAATSVMMETSAGVPSDIIKLTVDRPFMFLIYDEPTATLLFLGRVMDPS
jgi:serpin B